MKSLPAYQPARTRPSKFVSRGLTTKDLVTDSQTRGTVTFKLVKDGLSTRAAGDPDIDYLFSDIKIIDVTVTNTFTRVPVTIKNLKVSYKEEYEEHPNPDYTDDSNQHKDKYKDIGTAKCDSVVWLPAGTYQVTSYTIYKKSGIAVTTLDSRSQLAGEMFSIEDNKQTGRCYRSHPVVADSSLHQRLHCTESHLGSARRKKLEL